MKQSFRELNVWKKSIQVTVLVYEFTRAFPRGEIYGLTSADAPRCGFHCQEHRRGIGPRKQARISPVHQLARGSNCELQTQLIIARELQLATRRSAMPLMR
jgi:hypothetical protein